MKAELLVIRFHCSSADEVERLFLLCEQAGNYRRANSLVLVFWLNGDGGQLKCSIGMRFDLPAANDLLIRIHCHNEALPIQPKWVEMRAVDQVFNKGRISRSRFSKHCHGLNNNAAGTLPQLLLARLSRKVAHSPLNISSSTCLVRFGSALPRIWRITWPTNQPISVTFPPR